jgi:membrane protein required for colicin V production
MDISLSGLDIVFLVVIVFFTLRVGIKGFVKEFMSMAALILGIAVAVIFSGLVGQYIQPYLGVGPWSQVVAFLALFLITYVVVKLFENALYHIVERINLESLDRALGFFLGLAEGILVVFILILLIQLQPLFEAGDILAESVFARLLTPLLPYAQRIITIRT